MKELWSKFIAWLSGWPKGSKERILKKEIQEGKSPKGLNPKKKKKAKKQGNIS